MRRKLRARSHVMEDESIEAIKQLLPVQWVIREYRPDYGLDLAVEVFRTTEDPHQSEALGEHFFIQVKAVDKFKSDKVVVRPRPNVAKYSRDPQNPCGPHEPDEEESAEIEVLKYRVDTPLLNTVHAMGAAQVVLLFLIALDVRRGFFMCLNDYVDKVIIPADPYFGRKKTKTLLVPVKNEVSRRPQHLVPIRFYAKRSKFYSAFNLFNYQMNELEYCCSLEEMRSMSMHFVNLLKQLDIWRDTEMWGVVSWYDARIKRLGAILKDPDVVARERIFRNMPPRFLENFDADKLTSAMLQNEILDLWRGLNVLGRNYEELCREWFLPTYLAQLASYPD